MIDEADKVGYVRITSFSGETANDLEAVLRELESNGLKGLIIDLRFNTGGLLDSAVAICDKFLSKGLIVRTQPKDNVIPVVRIRPRPRDAPELSARAPDQFGIGQRLGDRGRRPGRPGA